MARIEEGRGKVAGSRKPEVRSYYRETAEDEEDEDGGNPIRLTCLPQPPVPNRPRPRRRAQLVVEVNGEDKRRKRKGARQPGVRSYLYNSADRSLSGVRIRQFGQTGVGVPKIAFIGI
jgi:hypothetical protein